jgi:predicted nucleic acid-binding protein
MIVVDANILIYAIVKLPQTSLARKVAAVDPDWAFPPLWRYEFTSAMTKMTRGNVLTPSQAETAIENAENMVAGREFAVDQVAALRLALAAGLSSYDATYIVLAQTLGIRCVTADAKVIRSVPATAVDLADFVAHLP